MKTYVLYVLLCVTIGTLVLANGAAEKSTQSPIVQNISRSTIPTSVHDNSEAAKPDTSSPTTTPSTTTPIPIISTTNIITSTSKSSTPSTTSSTPSTTSSTNPMPTSTNKPTSTSSSTTPVSPSTTNTTSNSTTAPLTTPVPPATASPSKDRHFDGLSFFGGIILATCLMAISVFAWKFYKQCNEGNYRTL